MNRNSFDGLQDRLIEGEEEAAAEVLRRFTERLVALARRRLDPRVARRVGADDVVQSVYRTFFVRQRAGQFDLDNWEGLWALLARITVRKCGRQAAAQRATRRDVRREFVAPHSDSDTGANWDPPNREPTPDEVAMLDETLTSVLAGLDPEKREMLVLRLQGHSVEEISQHVNRTERSVYRLLKSVRHKLVASEADAPPGG